MPPERRIAITGANGFIGSNLVVRLSEGGCVASPIARDTPAGEVRAALGAADVVFHLAGANRPGDPAEFTRSNVEFAQTVADAIAEGGRHPLLLVSSSTRAGEDSDYGRSKQAGEAAMLRLGERGLATVAVYRLPNVFGKWARPDYNSAVATFCHNAARGMPIRIDDPDAALSLLYVDDLIEQWLALVDDPPRASGFIEPSGVHRTTVGSVAEAITGFASGRTAGEVNEVGSGLCRALYATFVAALPPDAFSYRLTAHEDHRGSFTEMLRTPDCGQVSFFTALPGRTRGGHYHHSKVEKFVVVHGEATFRFRHVLSGASHVVRTSARHPEVVESIPGWAHDVTNVGDDVMVAVVWASERFNRDRPDTVAMAL